MRDERPWLVMKFGGTSVGSYERMYQVAEIVRDHSAKYRPIVVLSAMSALLKSEGTTSRLLKICHLISNIESHQNSLSASVLDLVEAVETTHISCAEKIDHAVIRDRLLADLRNDFQKFRYFLDAAQIIEEISIRTRDVIIGFGEKLSCRIFAAILELFGCSAAYLPLDRVYGQQGHTHNVTSLDQRFWDGMGQLIAQQVINVCDNYSDTIPVVTGFFGYVPHGILDSVGRGYSDFCAALIAAGLKRHPENSNSVQELQIWKEVDGIFSADPRQVKTARLLPAIFPDEAAELTYYGSEVIHPFTMEQVIRSNIQIRIKNTFKPMDDGTAIVSENFESMALVSQPQPSHLTGSKSTQFMSATAVTLKPNVICLNIHSNRKSVSHGFLAKIFTILDKNGIVVDLISTSEVHVSMAVSNSSNNLVNASSETVSPPSPELSRSKLEKIIQEISTLGEVSVLLNMAILSLVGKQMKNMVGIAGKMFGTLAAENVNIEMISQGASEINISCVVLEVDALRAIQKIHDVCVLGNC